MEIVSYLYKRDFDADLIKIHGASTAKLPSPRKLGKKLISDRGDCFSFYHYLVHNLLDPCCSCFGGSNDENIRGIGFERQAFQPSFLSLELWQPLSKLEDGRATFHVLFERHFCISSLKEKIACREFPARTMAGIASSTVWFLTRGFLRSCKVHVQWTIIANPLTFHETVTETIFFWMVSRKQITGTQDDLCAQKSMAANLFQVNGHGHGHGHGIFIQNIRPQLRPRSRSRPLGCVAKINIPWPWPSDRDRDGHGWFLFYSPPRLHDFKSRTDYEKKAWVPVTACDIWVKLSDLFEYWIIFY